MEPQVDANLSNYDEESFDGREENSRHRTVGQR